MLEEMKKKKKEIIEEIVKEIEGDKEILENPVHINQFKQFIDSKEYNNKIIEFDSLKKYKELKEE